MKIIGISGSPRNGNCEFMLKTILEGTNNELVLLRKENLQLCDGCMTCAGGKAPCRLNDISELHKKVKEADVIIFASPVWYDMISPHLLNFIVRLNCLQNDLKGKKFFFILSGQLTENDAKTSQGRAADYLKQIANLYEMNLINFILAEGVRNPEDAKNNPEIIKKCQQLSNQIALSKTIPKNTSPLNTTQ
jgi:multimeric flavodoxin WrbA